jgi:GNAT superfamily N-acetyltransferase
MSRVIDCEIVPVSTEHRRGWNRLFAAYAAFYRVEQTDRTREIVWQWLVDPDHSLRGLIALDDAGVPAGIAHYRTVPQSLTGELSGFLDDLFVEPPRRGVGVARALLGALAQIGRVEEWNSLSWMTAENNYRARALYDQVATKTIYLTYRMTL